MTSVPTTSCSIHHEGQLLAIVERKDGHILTTLWPGSDAEVTSANWPLPQDPYYVEVAAQCGFGPDRLMEYCHEHELLHSLLPVRFFGHQGYTITMSARQKSASLAGAKAEERLIYYAQRYIGGVIPAIDPQWETLKQEVSTMLYGGKDRSALGPEFRQEG